MYSLSNVVRQHVEKGYVYRIDRELDPELEPTKYIMKSDNAGTTLLFKVRGSTLECVSGVINTREKLYEVLRVSRDEDAYSKVINSLNSRSRQSLREASFRENYRELSSSALSLPAIKFYSVDGGRYITSSIVIAKTPDLDSYNASIHRLMYLDNQRFAIRLVPRHLYSIYETNRKAGRDTEVAVVIGAHPIVELAASISPPYGVFELEMVGNLGGEPLEVVRTPKYGIPVPARASVVMEGRITRELVREGPFVDILGLPDRVRDQPVLVVDSVYVPREDPEYFHVILPGGNEHMLLMGFPREAAIWDSVRRAVPKVKKVRLTKGGGMWLHAVISIKKVAEGDGKTAIMAAFAAHPSLKHVVVVDDDVDPDKPEEVEWAIATRLQAGKGLVIIHHARGSTLDPSSEDGLTDKVGIDATAPLNRREEFIRPIVE